MKKQFLILYIFFIISLGFSLNVDYGVSLDSYVGGSISDSSSVFGFEKLSLYSSIEVNDSLSLAIDGFYKYTYNSESDVDEPHTFDFTTLLATFPLGRNTLQVGRNSFNDYSADILSHTLDGVNAVIPLGFATLLGNAGYSGLVNPNEVSLFTTDEDDDVISRVIEGADLIKEMESMTLWTSLYSQQDMNSLSNNLSIYGGGGVSGSIGTDVYYSARGNYQTGYFPYIDAETDDSKGSLITAGMGAVTLNWYIGSENQLINKLSPYLTLDVGVSSGDTNLNSSDLGEEQPDSVSDGVTLYSPMISGGPGTIYSTDNKNLTYIKLQASASPLHNLQGQIGSVVFFRTVEGVTGDSEVNSTESGNYLGSEFSLTANYRPFSDLGVSLSGGVFFPDGTLLDKDPYGLITAYVSLSM